MRPGLGYAVLASFLFALMNAAAKFLSQVISVPEIVFYRGVIGVVLTLLIMRLHKIPFAVSNWPLLISRGLLGGASLMMAFFAISAIALAEASFLAHLSPLFVVVLGFALLKERMPRGFLPLFTLACGGAFLVSSPWNASLHAFYAGVGVLGAVLAASASIAIRQLSKDHNNETIMLGFLVTAALLPVPFVDWPSLVLPRGNAAVATLFLGTISFLAQYCLTQAYRLERAGLVATTRYSGVAFNIALGFFVFGEVPTTWGLAGGALILIACLMLSRLQVRDKG